MRIILMIPAAGIMGYAIGLAIAQVAPPTGGYEGTGAVSFRAHVDQATGCQYLSGSGSSTSFTPRIAADGKTHMGCRGVTP